MGRRLPKILRSLKRQRESDFRKPSFILVHPPAVGRVIRERNLGMASQIAGGVPVAQPSLAVCRTLWRWSPRAFWQDAWVTGNPPPYPANPVSFSLDLENSTSMESLHDEVIWPGALRSTPEYNVAVPG